MPLWFPFSRCRVIVDSVGTIPVSRIRDISPRNEDISLRGSRKGRREGQSGKWKVESAKGKGQRVGLLPAAICSARYISTLCRGKDYFLFGRELIFVSFSELQSFEMQHGSISALGFIIARQLYQKSLETSDADKMEVEDIEEDVSQGSSDTHTDLTTVVQKIGKK